MFLYSLSTSPPSPVEEQESPGMAGWVCSYATSVNTASQQQQAHRRDLQNAWRLMCFLAGLNTLGFVAQQIGFISLYFVVLLVFVTLIAP